MYLKNHAACSALALALLMGGCSGGLGQSPDDTSSETYDPQGQVVFVGTAPTGRTDLYLLGDQGQGLTVLTETLGDLGQGQSVATTSDAALHPIPSQDGQRVLFILERTATAEAAAIRELFEYNLATGDAYSLGLAPEGMRKAFYDRTGDRILMDVRDPSTGLSQLFLWTATSLLDLSEDGLELTFDGFFPDDHRLLVRVGSGNERQLAILDLSDASLEAFATSGGLEILSPRLSPDGRTVVFQGRGDVDACYDLFRVATTSPEDMSLAAPESLGASIGAWGSVYGNGGSPGDHEPVASEDATPDSEAAQSGAGYETSECLSVSAPSWAPDDSGRVAFLATTDAAAGRADAFVISLNEGDVEPLTTSLDADGPGVTSNPRWSPDGAHLLFTVNWTEDRGDVEHVDLYLSTDGEPATSITSGYTGAPSLAHWSVEGDSVLFWARSSAGGASSESSDAVVIDIESKAIEAISAGHGLHVSYPLWVDHNSMLY